MKPTAKKLILGLLLAREGAALSVSEAVSACALFDLTENNVRVTLARLRSEGLIESSERGSYHFGPAGRDLAEQVYTWHDAEQRLRDWGGGYIVASVAALGRSDRRAMRRRERALALLGMRELERGLYLRPDNLEPGVAGVRRRLRLLGLDTEAPVFSASDFGAAESQIAGLWDVPVLERRYREGRQRLQHWLDNRDALDPDTAARESYLLGGAAIRELVYDPWLPGAWIDVDARRDYLMTVQRFDAAGKAVWASLRDFSTHMPVAPAAQLHTQYA